MITNKPITTPTQSSIPSSTSIKLDREGLNNLLSTITPITDDVINLHNIHIQSIAPIPSSIPKIPSIPTSPLFNTEPMVSIQLSVLNDLVQKLKIYEFLLHQLLPQNMYINNVYYAPKMEQSDKRTLKAETTLISESISDHNDHQHTKKVIKDPSKMNARDITHIRSKYPSKSKGNNDIKEEKIGEYYVCGECGKRYKYRCNLRSHFKVHTDDAYICEYCDKRFGRKANYEQHRMVHNGTLPYKCNICKKKFRERYIWKNHETLHKDMEKLDLPCLNLI